MIPTQIRIGSGFWLTYDRLGVNGQIVSADLTLGNALCCDALSVDTVNAELVGGDLAAVRQNTSLRLNRAGRPLLYAWITSREQVGPQRVRVTAVSAIGQLDRQRHYGGIYTGQPLSDILPDVIGSGISYQIDAEAQSIPIYGWLPIATRRENLQQLLFASGISVLKNGASLRFALLDVGQPVQIDPGRIYRGASVESGNEVSGIDLTEHTFSVSADTEPETLFDGTAIASEIVSPAGQTFTGVLVTFAEPMHDLTITGASILESGANYAIISSGGSVLLEGRPYLHTRRVVSRRKPADELTGAESVMSGTDCTLISQANSDAVADRLLSYYGYASAIRADIAIRAENSELPGTTVRLQHPYDGSQVIGLIESMRTMISGIYKASCRIIVGYDPRGAGSAYTQSTLLTGSGTYTVPSGVTRLRAVLIGGGQGGYSGGAGLRPSMLGTVKGTGGVIGPGGAGGNVTIVTLAVTPGQQISYACGAGGAGGVSVRGDDASGCAPVPGAFGAATTFGEQSSEGGSPSGGGYADLFSAAVYGLPGDAGLYPGAESGKTLTVSGTTYRTGGDGASTYSAQGTAYGGTGGGPGSAQNGQNGSAGEIYWVPSAGKYQILGGTGGTGGRGRAGTDAVATEYGRGGNGGNGGGGGGTGGDFVKSNPAAAASYGFSGLGGLGGTGGTGAPGCILIYT